METVVISDEPLLSKKEQNHENHPDHRPSASIYAEIAMRTDMTLKGEKLVDDEGENCLEAKTIIQVQPSKALGLLNKLGFGGILGGQTEEIKETEVWDDTLTWDQRKILALNEIDRITPENLQNLPNQLELIICKFAYEGEYEKLVGVLNKKFFLDDIQLKLFVHFSSIHSTEENIDYPEEFLKRTYSIDDKKIKKSKFFMFKCKNGLTPLIYAIWGKIDETGKNNDKCIELFVNLFKSGSTVDQTKVVRNELGHLAVHTYLFQLITTMDPLPFFIQNDYKVSLIYFYEQMSLSNPRILIEKFILEGIEEVAPLAYSIRNKSLDCTNYIFNHIIDSRKKDLSSAVLEIEPNFHELFMSTSNLLEEFLEKMLESEKMLVKVDKGELPLMTFSRETSSKESFGIFGLQENEMYEIQNIQVKCSVIKLPSISGSYMSYELLKSLIFTKNLSVFRSEIIRYYIQYKWNLLWWFIFFQTCLMWINLALIIYLIVKEDFWGVIAFIVVNSLMLLFELTQLFSIGFFAYFGNVNKHILLYTAFVLLAIAENILEGNVRIFFFAVWVFVYMVSELFTKNFTQRQWVVVFFWLFLAGFTVLTWIQAETWLIISFITLENLILFYFIISLNFDGHHLYSAILNVKLLLTLFSLFYTKDSLILLEIISLNLLTFEVTAYQALSQKTYELILYTLILIIPPAISILYYLIDEIIIEILYYCLMIVYLGEYLIIQNLFQSNIKGLRSTFKFSFPLVLFLLISIQFYSGHNLMYIFFTYLVLDFLLRAWKKDKFLRDVTKNGTKFLFNWNTIDLIRVILCTLWVLEYFYKVADKELIVLLNWSVVLVSFARGLTGFRCFNGTRYYVRLILRSILDIKSFLIIFFYTTFAFGLISTVLREEKFTFENVWIKSFHLNLGELDSYQELNLIYLMFLAFSIINVIIMLNLLISILGDSFDRFQITAAEIDFIEMTDAIYEIESIMFWRRSNNNMEHLIAWDFPFNSQRGEDEVWEGKLKLIENRLTLQIDPIAQDMQAVKNSVYNLSERITRFEEMFVKINEIHSAMNLESK
ncbi:hypothetical protein SteCoe_4356 [Stentor coeruleus]|uniref:Ion transport domain-containing protein n=1 Tax=Stentor coeruleus TaxID=5963 RepID=A0A1R2CUZ6_9CILI|nr:hypothetical protein SteCoe_4356 [Stentor coeruleus]